jgi:transcriptional regulator with XRE-family HTH domain
MTPTSTPLPALVYWRVQRGITQAELAAQIGVRRATIARIESGNPALVKTAHAVAVALNVEVADLQRQSPEQWRASTPDESLSEDRVPLSYDWRPPRAEDWRCLRSLLNLVAIRLHSDAQAFDEAERDLRAAVAESWSIGIGRYHNRATSDRELATWVSDELGVLEGGHKRAVPLDDRGMFPGTREH